MKKTLILSTLAALFIIALSSCSKEEDLPAPQSNSSGTSSNQLDYRTNLLCNNGNWYLNHMILDTGNWQMDMIGFFDGCELDNFWNYNQNKTYVVDEGVSVCQQGDPQVIHSGNWNWHLTAPDSIVTDNNFTRWYSITADTLKLTYSLGMNYLIHEHYSHTPTTTAFDESFMVKARDNKSILKEVRLTKNW